MCVSFCAAKVRQKRVKSTAKIALSVVLSEAAAFYLQERFSKKSRNILLF